jgi:hypothetical protein
MGCAVREAFFGEALGRSFLPVLQMVLRKVILKVSAREDAWGG